MAEPGGELIKEYIGYVRSVRNLSEETVRAYRRDFDDFNDFLVDRGEDVLSVNFRGIRSYVASLSRRGLAAGSTNRRLSALRGFFRFLKRRGYRDDDPAELVRSAKTGKRLPEFLFEEEMEKILTIEGNDFPALRDRLIVEFLYATGCRISELVGVDVTDVDVKRRSVLLHGKGRKDRQAFLGDSALTALRSYLPVRSALSKRRGDVGGAALFLNRSGGRLTGRGVATILEKRLREFGVLKHVTPHTFRHSFATHILDRGADIRVVQELLGHSQLSTTQVYTHMQLGRLRDVYRQAHPHGRRDSAGSSRPSETPAANGTVPSSQLKDYHDDE
jgi:integrase/recombinase XerC/integrase/recombinase XerD